MNQHECTVYFELSGETPAAETLQQLLKEVVLPKDHQETGLELRCQPGSWRICSRRRTDQFIDGILLATNIIEFLQPHKQCLLRVKNRFGLSTKLQFVLYFCEDEQVSMPALGLAAKSVAFLAELGAELDIDCYRW